MNKPNPRFPIWPNAKCGHCGHDASKDPEDPYHYKLTCPTCFRDGCGGRMPMGRDCECPECENGDNE